jgi:hypothetical protein
MNQEEPPKKITIRLERLQRQQNWPPLGELLSKALSVIEFRPERPETWLSRWAIRAVCQAIIAKGEATFPLEVSLKQPALNLTQRPEHDNGSEMRSLEIEVPAKFLRLCEDYYKIDADSIAEALVYNFTLNPPESLTLVQRAKPDEDDKEGEEWKQG